MVLASLDRMTLLPDPAVAWVASDMFDSDWRSWWIEGMDMPPIGVAGWRCEEASERL